MGINFAAANMAGFNNPEAQVFRVDVNATGTKVLHAPPVATLDNIIKSGFLPVLYVTLGNTGNSVIAPLTAINSEGNYLFSCVFQISTTPTPVMLSLIYVRNSELISVAIINL